MGEPFCEQCHMHAGESESHREQVGFPSLPACASETAQEREPRLRMGSGVQTDGQFTRTGLGHRS